MHMRKTLQWRQPAVDLLRLMHSKRRADSDVSLQVAESLAVGSANTIGSTSACDAGAGDGCTLEISRSFPLLQ